MNLLNSKVKRYPLLSEPVSLYLLRHPKIEFLVPITACWPGYIGTWKIAEGKLYLIRLQGYLTGYKEVKMDYLFPIDTEVFAEWYLGELYISKDTDPATKQICNGEIEKIYGFKSCKGKGGET